MSFLQYKNGRPYLVTYQRTNGKAKYIWKQAKALELAKEFLSRNPHDRAFRNHLISAARVYDNGGVEALYSTKWAPSTIGNRIAALGRIGITVRRRNLKRLPIKPRFHKREEILCLLRNLPHSVKEQFIILALTGMRPIELQRLSKGNILWDKGVAYSISYKGRSGAPKVVWYSLPKPVLAFLKRRCVGKSDDFHPYPMDGVSVFYRWKCMLGLKHIRRYDLRHFFATQLLAETRDIRLVSQALNHEDITTTQRYAFALPNIVRDAVVKFRI